MSRISSTVEKPPLLSPASQKTNAVRYIRNASNSANEIFFFWVSLFAAMIVDAHPFKPQRNLFHSWRYSRDPATRHIGKLISMLCKSQCTYVLCMYQLRISLFLKLCGSEGRFDREEPGAYKYSSEKRSYGDLGHLSSDAQSSALDGPMGNLGFFSRALPVR